ncbi:MAG: hypothetical protein KY451_09950 [Actinobacteria bacterium]|nr:hypothetical protein [Actinomycetota bacterium]MBW3648786.1 hypothetical protein [Actinomycetota bacterium]
MTASRRLGALLCVAVLGVLFAGGLVVAALGGLPAVLAYAAGALILLGVAMVRGRHLLAPAAPPPGRTCTCCTASQHDPVRVV